jgi:CDP-4-dehydro-6-deoxyglucose reductase, E3
VAFTVSVRPSGHRFEVQAGEAILDAALRQGIRLPYGCRNGECGSCKGRLQSGEITYPLGEPPALHPREQALGYAIVCQAHARSDVTLEIREIDSLNRIPIRTLPCRVARREPLCQDVMGLWLRLPKAERLQFLAGQYVDVLLADGRSRSFSLANAPEDDQFLELHVRHYHHGAFSDFVFSGMHEGTLLRIRGPLGGFVLDEGSRRPIICIAGGTGFAPIKGLIEHAFAQGKDRPLHLYWGARSREDLYLDDLARGWAERHAQLRYTPVLSDPSPDEPWSGRTGLVHEAVLEDFEALGEYEVYASGPPPMVEAIRATLPSKGLDPGCLYSDSFERASDARPA